MCSELDLAAATQPGRATASAQPAIWARDLGRSYRLAQRTGERLREAFLGRGSRTRAQRAPEHWALRDLDLTIAPGTTVGVVGRNGSGKTTLLELVAGTLRPSRGEVGTRGRVAAILELGASMSPDFTGRENARLQAAISGLDRAQIDARLEGILAFADIGEFVDQPVRTYSSGMLLRLAMAVALAAEPDVLVVDEVLAVGDEPFQRKCFARLERLRAAGTTTLFASHDTTTVLTLCDAALLLDGGEALLYGDPKSVVERYLQLAFAPAGEREELRRAIISGGVAPHGAGAAPQRSSARFDPGLRSHSAIEYGPHGARISDPHVATLHGDRVNVLVRGESYVYRYRVAFAVEQRDVRFGMLIKTKAGFELGGSASASPADPLPHVAAGGVADVEFRFECRLLPGTYFLNAGVLARGDDGEHYLHRVLDASVFRVREERGARETGFVDFAADPRVVWRQLGNDG